jgi:protein-tyrosine-phosphatase
MDNRLRVVFLCDHNHARSQLAEGIFRQLTAGGLEVHSAGFDIADSVHPAALAELERRGIQTEGMKPQRIEDLPAESFTWVITLCRAAKEKCPWIPGSRTLHWEMEDPAAADEKERPAAFRRSADELEAEIRALLERRYPRFLV